MISQSRLDLGLALPMLYLSSPDTDLVEVPVAHPPVHCDHVLLHLLPPLVPQYLPQGRIMLTLFDILQVYQRRRQRYILACFPGYHMGEEILQSMIWLRHTIFLMMLFS